MALNIPNKIRAGDSLKKTVVLANYSATTWTLTIKIVNSIKIYSFVASPNGDDHEINVTAATTADWVSGKYKYIASISDGTDKYTIETGAFEVLKNLDSGVPTDERAHVEKVLESIEAVLEGKATKDHLEVSFNGRSITHLSPEQLLSWRDKYRAELRSIERAARVSRGLASGKIIKVRF